MTRATLARLIAVMLVLTAVTAVPMIQIDWNGNAASEERESIDLLLDVMIVLSCFVFAVVIVMLGYSVWKYRAKPGDESDGEPIHGNTRLEIAWTVIPTVIVLFGAIYSWIILDDIETQASDRMRVDVTAQQFKWTFEYPEAGGVKSDELVVPADRQLEIHITALDVLHAFWVPDWGIKRDAVPSGEGGDEIDDVFEVTPNEEGTYAVVCTELCGVGHGTMRAFARVVPQAEFDAWIREQQRQQQPAGSGGGGEAGS